MAGGCGAQGWRSAHVLPEDGPGLVHARGAVDVREVAAARADLDEVVVDDDHALRRHEDPDRLGVGEVRVAAELGAAAQDGVDVLALELPQQALVLDGGRQVQLLHRQAPEEVLVVEVVGRVLRGAGRWRRFGRVL